MFSSSHAALVKPIERCAPTSNDVQASPHWCGNCLYQDKNGATSAARQNEGPEAVKTAATQRIVKVRRDYNTWVANETLEDYALRFTPLSFRKWSEFRLANTALGAMSFLALEAIAGA